MKAKTCKAGLHVYEPGNGCRACSRAKENERARMRRATDPEYSARRSRVTSARQNNKRAEDPEYRARVNKQSAECTRKRCAEDPVYAEALRQYKRDWRIASQKDPQFQKLVLASTHRRRARLKDSQSPGVTAEQWSAICDRYTKEGQTFCAYCKTCGPVTREHVVPVARGGRDDSDNVLPVCKRCNCSKGDSLIHEWYRATTLLTDQELLVLREHTERCLDLAPKKTSLTFSSEVAQAPPV